LSDNRLEAHSRFRCPTHDSCRALNSILCLKGVQLFEGPLLGGQKRPKFGAISDNFRLRSRISPEWIDMSKIGKVVDQLQLLPRWMKKVGVLWSTNKKVMTQILIDPKCAFSVSWRNFICQVVLGYGFRGYSPGAVAASGISTTNRTCGAGRPHVRLCPIFPVLSYFLHIT